MVPSEDLSREGTLNVRRRLRRAERNLNASNMFSTDKFIGACDDMTNINSIYGDATSFSAKCLVDPQTMKVSYDSFYS